MLTEVKEVKILRKDFNGNIYSIPEILIEDFSTINEEIITADIGSEDWFHAKNNLDSEFGIYLKP